MLKFKRSIIILLCSCLVLTATACSKSTSKKVTQKATSPTEKSFNVNDLSIKDFKWDTSEGKENGYKRLYFNLTNNSNFDLLGIEVHFKPKKDVTDNQLQIFDSFFEKHKDFDSEEDSDEDFEEDDDESEDEDEDDYSFNSNKITLAKTNSNYSTLNISGDDTKLVKKGETFSGINLYIYDDDSSWNDVPSDEQFKLMELNELGIAIVGPANKGYMAYYNFQTKKWSLDKTTFTVDKWSSHEIGKLIPNPKAAHFIVRDDKKDDFDTICYGITKENYDKYIKKLIKLGFKSDDDEEDYSENFEGTNSKEYTVTIWYTEENEYMSLEIQKN